MPRAFGSFLQKRELAEQPDRSHLEKLDNYKEVHETAKADMNRSMNSLSQAMDEEKNRMDSSSHLFNEDSVEEDRLRGVDNIDKMRKAIELQDQVYRTIMTKVNEGGGDQKKLTSEHMRASSRDGLYSSSPYPIEVADTYRLQNACMVANHRVKGQLRHELTQQNKMGIAATDAIYHQALKDKHDWMDQKAARRQQEMVERQVLKTHVAQNKRNDQQKMLKEIQRDQDHQFELLQLKHHHDAVSHNKATAHDAVSTKANPAAPAPTASMAPTTPPGKPVRMGRSASEPIYRTMVESHSKYSSTLNRWRTFEADNEKRTDAYWRKMLQGDDHHRRKERSKPSKESGLKLFQSAAKSITAVRRFVNAATGSQHNTPEPGQSIESGPIAVDTRDTQEMSYFDTGRASSANEPGKTPTRALQRQRTMQAKAHNEDLEAQALEKLARDKAFLEEKQQRGKAFQNNKAERAGEGVKAWEKKSTASKERREVLSVQNDGVCIAKMAAASQRMDNIQADNDKQRTQLIVNNNEKLTTIKAGAEQNLQGMVTHHLDKQSEKDYRGKELLEVRMGMAVGNVDTEYADKVERNLAQKKAYDDEVRRKATDDIEKKRLRQSEALKRVARLPTEASQRDHGQGMERHRLLRKDRGRDDPNRAGPAELALPPELALSPRLLLSPKSAGTLTTAKPEFHLESPTGGEKASGETTADLDELERMMMDVVTRRTAGNVQKKSSQAPSSLLSMSGGMASSDANLGASAGGSSRRSEEGSEEGSEGEEQFLDDLRTQSSKWLKDMRAGADVFSSK